MKMTNTATNILTAKLFNKLAHLDLSTGIAISYVDGSIKAHIRGRTHHLTTTDSPSAWAQDGRRNWRAIKALCAAVYAAGDEVHATTPEEPAKPAMGLPEVQTRILSREERKALLSAIPKAQKKGEPKPSPSQSDSAKPAATRSASDILTTLSGSAKPATSRAPQQHRANNRRPR